jgi:hypothetical protein
MNPNDITFKGVYSQSNQALDISTFTLKADFHWRIGHVRFGQAQSPQFAGGNCQTLDQMKRFVALTFSDRRAGRFEF